MTVRVAPETDDGVAFEQWLDEADALLASWDPAREDDLDALVERGLALGDALTHLSDAARARTQLTMARVLAGLSARREEVGAEIEDLHRRRLEVSRNATGITTYIEAGGASAV